MGPSVAGRAQRLASRRLDRASVRELRGVGPRIAARLARLGVRTVEDLLLHLPLRYEDRTRVVAIGAVRPGETASVEGTIQLTEVVRRRRPMLLVHLADGTGALVLRFFHFTPAQQRALARGVRLRCYGEVRPGPRTLEMVHPEYRSLEAGAPLETTLTPVYPATEGLTQPTLRALSDQALEALDEGALPERLPGDLLRAFRLPALAAALRYVHRPPPEAELESLTAGAHPAQRRLAFEELLAHQLSLKRLRQAVQSIPAPALEGSGRLRGRLREALPFTLTGAQIRTSEEVARDLARRVPMLRLVQGDVGSGKTVVAALAALQAVEAGYQAALMAPTELLAEQHYRTLAGWLAPLEVEAQWLGGRHKGAARRAALDRVASGEAAVVVGTHALFQEAVAFHRLGLVIVDEQHRFGVHQRLALREKGTGEGRAPHQLIMTATPIPRTLAMTAYADLDSSVIDELPPGRTPVRTVAVPEVRREEVIARIREACASGRQAYWVCNLIEASEQLEAQAAAETAEALRTALPRLRVGLVHGRMKPAEKEQVMREFKADALDLLVATTVIEVGVDVPNASLMIIENAERFGLAQLHQLRGRVGRGSTESTCVLLYKPPLTEMARARLAVLRETNDGFAIAQEDLELRGPGEVLGTRQTGLLNLRVADLVRDRDLLPTVQRAAERLLREHPEHVAPLIERWVGEAARYGTV